MSPTPNIELVTCVDVRNVTTSGPNPKPVFQFLYASQLYGTLFAIYGQFTSKTLPDGSREVESVKLMLVNYQGVLNIGFTNHPLYYDGTAEQRLYFGVRGACSVNEKPEFKFNPSLKIPAGGHFRLRLARILYPLTDFEFVPSDRQPLKDIDQELSKPIPQSQHFDTEFQYRSGAGFYDHALKPGLVEHSGLSIEKLIKDGPLVSFRCHEGQVNLF